MSLRFVHLLFLSRCHTKPKPLLPLLQISTILPIPLWLLINLHNKVRVIFSEHESDYVHRLFKTCQWFSIPLVMRTFTRSQTLSSIRSHEDQGSSQARLLWLPPLSHSESSSSGITHFQRTVTTLQSAYLSLSLCIHWQGCLINGYLFPLYSRCGFCSPF